MRVRVVTGKEKVTLRPWYQPWSQPHLRTLDAQEINEVLHLYRTRQATGPELARRFGVSIRTIRRYIAAAPTVPSMDAAGLRVLYEARRIGINLTPRDAQRLATVALMGEVYTIADANRDITAAMREDGAA